MNRCRRVKTYIGDVETRSGPLTWDEDRGEPVEHSIGIWHKDGVTLIQALVRNEGTCRPNVKGAVQSESLREDQSTDVGHRGGDFRSRVEGAVMVLDRRGIVDQFHCRHNSREDEVGTAETKPFEISKREVWEAYKRVKSLRGAAGIDDVTIEKFEQDLSKNLYKIWNRMSSGCYFPPAVKHVEIPKGDGGTRALGIPTISDRVAQLVVKRRLESVLEPIFHDDSYGYRPGRSAHDALRRARNRCWKHDWVLDLDIKGFFDNIDHGLLLRAVRKHTSNRWLLLYIERWLKADVSMPDGTVQSRDKGTPQGGVIAHCWRICFCTMPSIAGCVHELFASRR